MATAPGGKVGGDMAVALCADDTVAAGDLAGLSFFLRGTGMGGPPGVPGNGCLRGLPRPRCGVGPGVTPGVPGVPGVPGAPVAVAAEAAALAVGALALLLLGGLDGVAAAGVDGVPGIELAAGMRGADVGVPIGTTPDGIGTPLGPTGGTPDMAANGSCGVPAMDAYADGWPNCGDGMGRPLDPGWKAVEYDKLVPSGNGKPPGVLAGVLTAEYGLGMASDPAAAAVGAPPANNMGGAEVAVEVEAGDGAAGTLLIAGAGGSGGGVKMPNRCLASRSFSSLAALAAALSC